MALLKIHPIHPVNAYYLRNCIEAFNSGLIQTALFVFFVRTLALTPLQLALVGVVHMLAHVLLEIPTGVIADVRSRKLSVLIGGALVGFCYVLTGTLPFFAIALLGTFIEAAGDTFVSGALDAWLNDEVGVERAATVILRSEQLGTPFHWAGVGASVLLATLFNHQTPIILGGALWLLATPLLAFAMPETRFIPRVTAGTSLRSSIAQMRQTLLDGVRLLRSRRMLILLFVAQALIGAFDGGMYRLNQLHLFANFTLPEMRLPWIGTLDDSAWIALITAAESLLYVIAIAVLRKRVDINDAAAAPRLLSILFGLVAVLACVYALTSRFDIALTVLLAMSAAQLLTDPLLRTWLNRNIGSDVRATMLSMSTQVHRFGMLSGGLLIGGLGDSAGLRIAIVVAALFLPPLLWVFRAVAAKPAEIDVAQ